MTIGSIPDWLGALATVAAVAAAVYAGLSAKNAYQLERQRDRIRQASLVSAWPAQEGDDGPHGVMVANHSLSIIYDVAITVTWESSPPWSSEMTVVPPGRYFVRQPRPGHERFPTYVADDSLFHPVMSTDRVAVDLRFRDAIGLRWHRPPLSDLTQISRTQ